MTHRITVAALAATALLTLSACIPDGGGVVTKRYTTGGKGNHYNLCVRADSGEEGCSQVAFGDFVRCRKGERYPGCAK